MTTANTNGQAAVDSYNNSITNVQNSVNKYTSILASMALDDPNRSGIVNLLTNSQTILAELQANPITLHD